jgi:hypothetical protein
VIRVRRFSVEKVAVLVLDCGHATTAPLDDEESLSFLGSETECQRCATWQQWKEKKREDSHE